MANPKHLAILKQGVAVWNEWRRGSLDVLPDLSEAVLDEANLSGADLSRVDLRGASLVWAMLSEVDLTSANLGDARLSRANFTNSILAQSNLSKANLTGAYLVGVDLRDANLSRADLRWAEIVGSDLRNANLRKAQIGWTTFADVNLSTVKGLDTTEHMTSSTIGIDTIYRSGGNIPEVFLRGCGVPETFIIYARSLVGKPIDFYSCFISHSSKDKRFCERLYADLQAKAVRVWYFPEDAKWGEPVWSEIDRSIKVYDKLIVVCSKNSLTSGPVLREIERSLNREDKERKNILFPVTLDDYIFDGWEHPRKADVLAKVVGDFRGWSRNAAKYDAAFKKLLKALKAD